MKPSNLVTPRTIRECTFECGYESADLKPRSWLDRDWLIATIVCCGFVLVLAIIKAIYIFARAL